MTANEYFANWDSRDKKEQRRDIEVVCSTPEGRRFIMRLLCEFCGIYEPSNEQDLARQAGRRDAGLAIMRAVNAAVPFALMTAQAEQNEVMLARAETLRELERKTED